MKKMKFYVLNQLKDLFILKGCIFYFRVTPQDLEGVPVNLKYVKFQNVQNVQLFIKDNQGGGELTQIDHLAILGSPICTTNMSEFKRVAGKKGESH